MSLINDVLKLVSKLPPEGLELLSGLIKMILKSPDPLDSVKRAAAVTAVRKAYRAPLKRSR